MLASMMMGTLLLLQKDKHDFVDKDVTSLNDKTYLHDSICTKHSVHQIRTLTTARGGF